MPNGQFGSRNKNGNDAASPRYIFTQLNQKLCYALFPREDDYLLELNIKLQDAIDDGVNPNFTQQEVNTMMEKLNIMQNLPVGEPRYPGRVIQAVSIILGKFMNGGRRKSRKTRGRKSRVRKSRK
jgi:hypothetical protein